ncbi:MAG: tyrosine-type recombinase/integrase [Chlamydiales bacterium]
MNIQEGISFFKNHQRSCLKAKTFQSYEYFFTRFESQFSDRLLESIRPEEMYQFLETWLVNAAKATRRLRFAQLKAFYNLLIENSYLDMRNPCSSPLLSKSFRMPKQERRKILDKETVDEMIYNAKSLRDRLILELQARCGLRIGEVLGLKVRDISDRKLILKEPKSGKDEEMAFMPEQVAKRLLEYVNLKKLAPEDHIFPICYSTARTMIKNYGVKARVQIAPHDLRRHSATYASRNGVPLEIVSKVILRHQDLKTTQIYLGKVSDSEAIRWMDTLHER